MLKVYQNEKGLYYVDYYDPEMHRIGNAIRIFFPKYKTYEEAKRYMDFLISAGDEDSIDKIIDRTISNKI